ncbi:MAG: nickel pincer cofactor biosynthesis protein LarB [Chlamydiota bacterium]|nr:nickel pincer cofactor biosynthesis protein LarB [Chlamydiota bacterium]
MEKARIEAILKALHDQKMNVPQALQKLKTLPFEDIKFAKIDHHRSLRTGHAEAVFCEGKTDEEALQIIKRIVRSGSELLATRASKSLFRKVKKAYARADYHDRARIIKIEKKPKLLRGNVFVLSAGTSDLSVAEEAAITAEFFGSKVHRIYDVGVAGLHRLLDQLDQFEKARVFIVVAGMEGALPSVVAGLVSKPVIAVPTSVGYGANFGGLTPLLAMLNSCAPGVMVVNIDNGFGAGVAANQINNMKD